MVARGSILGWKLETLKTGMLGIYVLSYVLPYINRVYISIYIYTCVCMRVCRYIVCKS